MKLRNGLLGNRQWYLDDYPIRPQMAYILMTFAVDPESPITMDDLAMILWGGEDEPEYGYSAIQVHVCKLNKRMTGWRIVGRSSGGGYRLTRCEHKPPFKMSRWLHENRSAA